MTTIELIALLVGVAVVAWLAGQHGRPFRLPSAATTRPRAPSIAPPQPVVMQAEPQSRGSVEGMLEVIFDDLEQQLIDRKRDDARRARQLGRLDDLKRSVQP